MEPPSRIEVAARLLLSGDKLIFLPGYQIARRVSPSGMRETSRSPGRSMLAAIIRWPPPDSSRPYNTDPSRDHVAARNAGLRRIRRLLPSGLSSIVPSWEAVAIQSPRGDHSGVASRTERSICQTVSAIPFPPTRAFMMADGGPCETNAIQVPSGDQVGAHWSPFESAMRMAGPPADGEIQTSQM